MCNIHTYNFILYSLVSIIVSEDYETYSYVTEPAKIDQDAPNYIVLNILASTYVSYFRPVILNCRMLIIKFFIHGIIFIVMA